MGRKKHRAAKTVIKITVDKVKEVRQQSRLAITIPAEKFQSSKSGNRGYNRKREQQVPNDY